MKPTQARRNASRGGRRGTLSFLASESFGGQLHVRFHCRNVGDASHTRHGMAFPNAAVMALDRKFFKVSLQVLDHIWERINQLSMPPASSNHDSKPSCRSLLLVYKHFCGRFLALERLPDVPISSL